MVTSQVSMCECLVSRLGVGAELHRRGFCETFDASVERGADVVSADGNDASKKV